MHWLVEVSQVGEETASERYCIDARRWQSALQEARRLRGDPGALPKLTIELLDHGYRAVDPALKVRYVVREAPPDLPLTEGAQVAVTIHPPPAESIKPEPRASASPPAQSIPAADAGAPRSGSVIPAQVIRHRDEQPSGDPIAYRELALAVKAGSSAEEVEALMRDRLEEAKTSMPQDAKRYVQIAVFDHVFVKRPVRAPLATLMWKEWRGDPVLAFPGYGAPAPEPPATSASVRPPPSWFAPAVSIPPTAGTGSSAPATVSASASAPVPSAVPAPAPRAAPFESVPPTAPAPMSSVPPASTADVGAATARVSASPGSVKPSPVVSVGKSTPPKSAAPVEAAPRPASQAPPPPSGPPLPSGPMIDVTVESAPPSSGTMAAIAQAALMEAEAERVAKAVQARYAPTLPAAQAPTLDEPAAEAPVPLTRRSEPSPPAEVPVPLTRRSDAPASAGSRPRDRSDPPTRRSDPGVARRRAPTEDLIGDLFERMHELSFMIDLVSGADFVVHVLSELIPCEGIVVHAFDLAKQEFVVVRARGPKGRDALLFRTPDDDPIIHAIMKKRSVASNGSASVRSGAFALLGVEPRFALCGAARQGGRYLGLLELANPLGDTPFHEGEVNAFEYVCEQFAEFVAQRPVVLDPDVVLGP
jgi:hypothetical protein